MGSTATKPNRIKLSVRAKKVLASARSARRTAVKQARLHGVPIVYLRDGKIVRERL